MVERSKISDEYKWNIADIFVSVKVWKEEYSKVDGDLIELESFVGKLNNPKDLIECLSLKYMMEERVSLLYLYALLKADEDIRIGENQSLLAEIIKLDSKYRSCTSFIYVELLGLGSERLKSLGEEEGLQIYKHFFDNISRNEKHILDAKEENLIAKLGELDSSASNIFNILSNANLTFEDVEDKDGKKHKLTKGTYIVFSESYDEVLRKNAFINFHKEYAKLKDTIAQIYIENLKKDRISAEIRNYNSVLEMKLSSDNIPTEVYENLLTTVKEHLKPIHKLAEIRKKILKLDKLYTYDMSVPLVKEVDTKIKYEEAVKHVLESVKILGEDYYKTVKGGFENRWVDVYENVGKASGAYSGSVPGIHPYILMNYNDTYGSMFTLAHEMGHALHSELTHKNQPQAYADYSIFTAETASTVNEGLLFEYLMSVTTDPKKRAYLLNKRIDKFLGTLFYQTTLAAFEKKAHELAAEGKASLETLSQAFIDLRKEEQGPLVNFPENAEFGWLRIPHFYRSFYVYQYATGFCSSIALVEKIKTEGQPAVDAYLEMLKAGSSDYSLNLLKKAGVDLTTKEPIEAAMRYFSNLVDQLEEELEKIQ